jgi:hypothetical protein
MKNETAMTPGSGQAGVEHPKSQKTVYFEVIPLQPTWAAQSLETARRLCVILPRVFFVSL